MTRISRNTQYALLLLLVLAGLATAPVFAQGSNPPTDDDVNAIAKQLYCPVCENTPLDVCPTQACAQWRDQIRLMLSQGKSEAEIKQYFADNYGARVLNEPPREGLNWLVYLVPRAMKKPVVAAALQGPKIDAAADDYVARLEAEIKKRN
jgi:cytochrome c-type biogenesis protein CcmH